MNWLALISIILSAATAGAVCLALITTHLAEPENKPRTALFVFLVLLLINQLIGFVLYTLSVQDAFQTSAQSGSFLFRLLSLVVLLVQYSVFVSTTVIVPKLFGMSFPRRFAFALACIAFMLIIMRMTGKVPRFVVLLMENIVIIPLVYGVWLSTLIRSPKRDRLLQFLVIGLVVTGLLERASSDPFWPVPNAVRDTLSGLPLAMTTVLVFSVALTMRNMRTIRVRTRGELQMPDFSGYELSPREKEIAELLFRGYANKEIAQKFSISYGTVKNHVYSLYAKLGIRSRFELQKFR